MLFGNVFVAIFFGHRKFYIEVFFFCQFLLLCCCFFSQFYFCRVRPKTYKHIRLMCTLGLCDISHEKGCGGWGREAGDKPKLTRLMVGNARPKRTTYSKIFFFLSPLMLTPFGCNSPLSFVSASLALDTRHWYGQTQLKGWTYSKICTRSELRRTNKLHEEEEEKEAKKNNAKNEHIKWLVICDP